MVEAKASAADLATRIATLSRNIEMLGRATELEFRTEGRETTPWSIPDPVFDRVRKAALAVLREYRAEMIIELAGASGLRHEDRERLALGEGKRSDAD